MADQDSVLDPSLLSAIPLRVPRTLNRGRSASDSPFLTDSFRAGPENRVAAFVCQPGISIRDQGNPLLLIGPSGCGKTSLALTILAHISARSKAKTEQPPTILQLPATDFARRYAEAVDGDDLDRFRELIENADLLLIDDVHLIADKGPAQEELANRLSVRSDFDRETVLTCRRLPTEIRGLKTILTSRMLPGLMVPISLPGPAARLALLKDAAGNSGLSIDESLLLLLEEGLPNDIAARRLFASISQVVLACREANGDPNTDMIQRAIATSSMRDEPTMQSIAQVVAKRFKLKVSDLKGATRKQQVVRARALAMFLGRKLTEQSLQQIGDYFGGRDHTTVLHACRKTETLLGESPELSRAAEDALERLQSPG